MKSRTDLATRLRTRVREYRVIRRPKKQIVDPLDLPGDTSRGPAQPDHRNGDVGGGSARFLASICDLMNRGRIVTIDIEDKPDRPQHQRITYMLGSSTSPEIVERVRSMIGTDDRVLVILDSDHSKAHILQELVIYSDLVTPGSYVIVEDSNVNGHPVSPSYGPGPMEALREFLSHDHRFEIDHTREKFPDDLQSERLLA